MEKKIETSFREGKEIEEMIEELLSEMTLEEKVALCHGNTKFTSAGCERLQINGLSLSDGPNGVREEIEPHEWKSLEREEDKCTYLPTGSALAATWSPEMARLHGKVLGSEARARGKDIILAPSINIVRHPLCGRNFEYMSEDPYLTSQMAPAEIEGIQSEDVSACVKHFIMNNQEYGRCEVDVDVCDKALHEIYLKGFKSSVNSYSFMGAYNKFRSHHCCHNDQLINGLLKGEWGYDGVFMSDWFGAHDTEESVYGGLDLEMGTERPYNEYYLADPFLKMAKENATVREILDDKASRILRLMFRCGMFDPERSRGSFNTSDHQRAAYDIAAEAMTLLKNDKGILPLGEVESILVIGENAVKEHAHGGGSSGVKALYEVTLLDGIKKAFPRSKITYTAAAGLDFKDIPVECLSVADTASGCKAFKCETFENSDFTGKKQVEYIATLSDAEAKGKSRVFVGEINIQNSADYYFEACADAGVQVWFGDERMMELEGNKMREVVRCRLEKGDTVLVIIKAVTTSPITFKWSCSDNMMHDINELCEAAKKADAVIYCGGLNHNFDSECFDRKDMKLPEIQLAEIAALLDAVPDTVIALTAGSPVEMPWIDKAHAVLWTWYAGLEAGSVFGDILRGQINPSGKLPITFPKRLEDSPSSRYGEYRADKCTYREGMLVGYRGYDADDVSPLFPFGHGLSFTDFEYSCLSLEKENGSIKVTLMLKNAGEVDGRETVQIYLGKKKCLKGEIPRELKGFEKIFVKAGEEKKVCIVIDKEELSEYDEKTSSFRAKSGEYTVYAAASSRDIRLSGDITL